MSNYRYYKKKFKNEYGIYLTRKRIGGSNGEWLYIAYWWKYGSAGRVIWSYKSAMKSIEELIYELRKEGMANE